MKRRYGFCCPSDDSDDDILEFSEENDKRSSDLLADIYRINRGGEAVIVKEVLRIKKEIEDNSDKSLMVLEEPLRRLQVIIVSVDTLKKTLIGVSVNRLKKHSSMRVRQMATSLVVKWKKRVEEALVESKNEVTKDATKELVNRSSAVAVVDENQKFGDKLEAAKRKLKEGYEGGDDAKKQHRVRVLELKDLPCSHKSNNPPCRQKLSKRNDGWSKRTRFGLV